MITIIDFGGGNLRSVQKSIEYVGFQAEITNDAETVRKATHLVFPGNGAFGVLQPYHHLSIWRLYGWHGKTRAYFSS